MLKNKEYVINKEKIFKEKGFPEFTEEYLWMPFCYLFKKYPGYESETASVIDSIMQSVPNRLIKKYLSKKIKLQVLTQKNVELFLQNDSITFVDIENVEILKLSTINSICYDRETDCLFIFNTNRSFYFINQNLRSNQKKYDLPFESGCLDAIWIKYDKKRKKYKLEKDWQYRFVGEKYKGDDWVYFDEIYGISKAK